MTKQGVTTESRAANIQRMKLKKIVPEDAQKHYTTRFDAVELKTMYNALVLDTMSDDAPEPRKVQMLDRLNDLLEFKTK